MGVETDQVVDDNSRAQVDLKDEHKISMGSVPIYAYAASMYMYIWQFIEKIPLR